MVRAQVVKPSGTGEVVPSEAGLFNNPIPGVVARRFAQSTEGGEGRLVGSDVGPHGRRDPYTRHSGLFAP